MGYAWYSFHRWIRRQQHAWGHPSSSLGGRGLSAGGSTNKFIYTEDSDKFSRWHLKRHRTEKTGYHEIQTAYHTWYCFPGWIRRKRHFCVACPRQECNSEKQSSDGITYRWCCYPLLSSFYLDFTSTHAPFIWANCCFLSLQFVKTFLGLLHV